MRELLGGKGANVAEMTRVLGAERVPAGFTITTEACVAYMEAGAASCPTGSRSRSPRRSSASRSRPARRSATPTTRCSSRCARARASRCRACSTPSSTSASTTSRSRASRARPATSASPGTPTAASCRCSATSAAASRASASRRLIAERKREAGVELDTELGVDDLKALTERFKEIYREETGEEFPQDPREQLTQAIRAVFDSWMGERAVEYRRINRIPDDWGTAVNVQQMVFGNKGDDVVLGRRLLARRDHRRARARRATSSSTRRARTWSRACATPRDLARDGGGDARGPRRADGDPAHARAPLPATCRTPSSRSRRARLYMLQTRNAKRPAQAAVRFAVDAVEEGLLDKGEALLHDRRRQARRAAAPDLRPATPTTRCWRAGVAASPGAAKGAIVFTADEAVAPRRGRART